MKLEQLSRRVNCDLAVKLLMFLIHLRKTIQEGKTSIPKGYLVISKRFKLHCTASLHCFMAAWRIEDPSFPFTILHLEFVWFRIRCISYFGLFGLPYSSPLLSVQHTAPLDYSESQVRNRVVVAQLPRRLE
jgi:hypothetical protein